MSANGTGERPASIAAAPKPTLPRVVIVGAGFGGLETARRLAGAPVEVILVDRHNYHLFTPLLYQVATAGLEPEEIAHPVRGILRGQKNIRFLIGEVKRIDLETHTVEMAAGSQPYDYVVLAAGSANNFFGIDGIERSALGLKDVDEALALRNRILACFEAAAWEDDPERRAVLLTFVVVGGGPTGVEFAGALRELMTHVLPRDYPDLDFSVVRVILIEAAAHLLAPFAPKLRRAALDALQKRGVEVRLNTAIGRLDGDTLFLKDGGVIRAGTVMWAAGVRAEDLAATVAAEHVPGGRVAVLPTLQIPGHPEAFVVGDMAGARRNCELLPMLAPVAQQEARCAAANIDRLLRGRKALPFRYRDRGTMATIGRNAAIAQIGPLRFTGFLAWLVWLGLHIVTLIGFRNRLLVLVNWAWDYLFYDRAVRLILEASPPTRESTTSDGPESRPDGE
jgi:NADH dehydrogenase